MANNQNNPSQSNPGQSTPEQGRTGQQNEQGLKPGIGGGNQGQGGGTPTTEQSVGGQDMDKQQQGQARNQTGTQGEQQQDQARNQAGAQHKGQQQGQARNEGGAPDQGREQQQAGQSQQRGGNEEQK